MDKHRIAPQWLRDRRRATVGVALALAAVLVLVGVLAATLSSDGVSHGPNDSRVCGEARQLLQAVQQPLQAGDIQSTIQAAQLAVPQAMSLGHQLGLSRAVLVAVKNTADAIAATADGSASSIPRAQSQLAAACRPG